MRLKVVFFGFARLGIAITLKPQGTKVSKYHFPAFVSVTFDFGQLREMHTMQKTLAAAMLAATLGMGGGAFAADVYSSGGMKDAPFAIPETSWTGFYAGVNMGAAWSASGSRLDVQPLTATEIAELPTLQSSPLMGRLEAGRWL